VTLTPKRTAANRKTHVRLRVRGVVDGRSRPLADALVRLAGLRVRTNARGRATARLSLPAGSFRAVVTKPGFKRGAARIRATKR
jgi:hypothetical protein